VRGSTCSRKTIGLHRTSQKASVPRKKYIYIYTRVCVCVYVYERKGEKIALAIHIYIYINILHYIYGETERVEEGL